MTPSSSLISFQTPPLQVSSNMKSQTFRIKTVDGMTRQYPNAATATEGTPRPAGSVGRKWKPRESKDSRSVKKHSEIPLAADKVVSNKRRANAPTRFARQPIFFCDINNQTQRKKKTRKVRPSLTNPLTIFVSQKTLCSLFHANHRYM